MARTSEISFSQVAQIADTMKAAGHRPTARAVRERIGSGSMGTIHRYIQQYNGQQQSDESEAAELPDSIAKALMDFVQTEVATACEPVSALLFEQKAEAAALAEENERLEKAIARLHQERDEAQKAQSVITGELVALRREYVEIRNDAESLKEIKSNQLREIDRLTRQVETQEAAERNLKLTIIELNSTRNSQQEAEKAAAVLAAQLDAANDNVKDLRERLTASETMGRNWYNEAKTANAHYQACAARLEEAARTIDELKKKAQPTAKVVKAKTTAKPTDKAE